MIRVEHLQKTYDRRSAHANHVLRDISLTLPDTGFVCILGPSGCGKTTLMNVVGGLDTFDSGTVTVGDVTAKRYGTEVMEAERNRRFGYIFQNYYLLPERTVTYNVYLGLHSLNLSRREKLERVKAALQAVEMEKYARRNVRELSGGQQQRVAIARALARQPQVIFADEPTGNLDEFNTDNICRLLRQLSKRCLIVMVTHEERIAEQYADRVITLEQGKIVTDRVNVPEKHPSETEAQNSAGMKPAITQTRKKDLENEPGKELKNELGKEREDRRGNAGKDRKRREKVTESGWETAFREAGILLSAKRKRTGALWACLVVLTAMLVLAVGDYMTVASIDPEEFIVTDSHLLEIEVMRGGTGGSSVNDGFQEYMDYLKNSGLDMTYIPVSSSWVTYDYRSFIQMNTLSEKVYGFSFIPVEKLDASTLIHGRMPEAPDEVVADRWTLERFLEGNGVLQASIEDLTHFLGKSLAISKKSIKLTIVGICDSGEPSVYVDPFALISMGSAGAEAMSLSQLKAMFPGKYDDIELADGEILTGPNAGARRKNGESYSISARLKYTITATVEEDIYAKIIVNDDQCQVIIDDMLASTRNFYIYTQEKEAVKRWASTLPDSLKDVIQVKVDDPYSADIAVYRAEAAKKVNARTIVTLTILLIAAVMLLLLLKARVDERKEMLGVYRLLGIPNGRTLGIYGLESIGLSLAGALPAAITAWAVIKALTVMPSISFSMVLPFTAALLAYGASLVFHLAASLLPAVRLLHLPPAVLAGRYDF